MDLEISGEMFTWRGPAPYHFVAVPEEDAEELRSTAALVTYGWGMIPVACRVGETSWTTSLWPKDGRYIVPIKDVVRKGEALEVGQTVTVHLHVEV